MPEKRKKRGVDTEQEPPNKLQKITPDKSKLFNSVLSRGHDKPPQEIIDYILKFMRKARNN